MNVFIDTNILLNFYRSPDAELDELFNVFASHKQGAAKVYLTQQVFQEFTRRRDITLKEALKRVEELKFGIPLPSFMKRYKEFTEIREVEKELQKKLKSILELARVDIISKKLAADDLIENIFKTFPASKRTDEIFKEASTRMSVGNPPGKKGAIGDAINWVLLLNKVPDGEDIHVISEDGDYFSDFDKYAPNSFLKAEWKTLKKGDLKVYRKLYQFMEQHFDGVAFSYDKNKDALIEDLGNAAAYSTTHAIIGDLEKYQYFSLNEVERILTAATENNQFGAIVTDQDITEFLKRVALPRLEELKDPTHKGIIETVLEGSKNPSLDEFLKNF